MRATKGSGNVFVDCGFSPAEAENLRIRAKMMVALTDYIQERKITQSRAAGRKVDVDITAGGPRAKSKRVA
jgi:predicted XRE-type DNA-binding protein